MKYRLNSLFPKCLGEKTMKELQSPKMKNIFKCVQNAFNLHFFCLGYCYYDDYYNIITCFQFPWWRQMYLTDLLTMYF